MAGDLLSFGKELAAFAKAINASADAVVTQTALAVYRGVKESTPVKTGYARDNWQIAIGAPATSQRPIGDHEGADVATLAARSPGSVVWISNNADYIQALERGHSGQAPQGMARITVENIKDRMKATVAESMRGRA